MRRRWCLGERVEGGGNERKVETLTYICFYIQGKSQFSPSIVIKMSMLSINSVFIDLIPENNCFWSHNSIRLISAEHSDLTG